MGNPPIICRQHPGDSSTSHCSFRERQTFHSRAMSPCLIHYPWQAQKHPQVPPQPRETELVRWSFAKWSRVGVSGTAQLPPPAAGGRRARTGIGRRAQGSAHCPSRQPRMPAPFLGCWQSRSRPCSGLLPTAASGSFPGEAGAGALPAPGRSWPCLAAEHAGSDGKWLVGPGEQRVPSAE